ncbi:MAG: thiamine pyrophosphate-binding protein [Rhodospirillales bacterium]
MTPSSPEWPEDIFRALRDMDVRQVVYVPDAGHARLLELCAAEPAMTMVPLTTEEEGIAVLAGAWLGGRRGVLLMQSSGIGNCVNMLSLTRNCRFPLLIVVTMRGQAGEANPWQVPMGRISGDVLGLAGVMVDAVDEPGRVGEAVTAGGRTAFDGAAAVAVLIAQTVVGIKDFGEQAE